MGETQNLRTERFDKYDSLYGRWMREIKTTNIPDIGAKKAATTVTADLTLSTYTTDADHAYFPYLFTVHSTNTAAQFIIYKAGTTTALSIQVDSKSNETIEETCDCPLMRIAPSSTVSIVVPAAFITNTTDTYAAFLIGKLEPIPSVVEN